MESNWLIVIVAAVAGSLLSLIGGLFLLNKRIDGRKIQRFAIPFAAGALLAASFFDLMPEAFEADLSDKTVATIVLGGFLFFFALERFLGWFHHHQEYDNPEKQKASSTKSLVIIGDTVHNTIDGVVIGSAFLVDPVVGIVATVAVAAHEIPQEIGDFALLLSLGMKKRRVLLVNVLSAMAAVVAAVIVYAYGGAVPNLEPTLLAFTAGLFIYIAASDLIPTIHAETKLGVANLQAMVLLLGIIVIGLTTTYAHHQLGGVEHGPSHGHEGEV